MLFAIIGIIIVLFVVLVWVNVQLSATSDEPHKTKSPETSEIPQSLPSLQDDIESASDTEANPVAGVSSTEDVPVEVLHTETKPKTLFEKPLYPFKLMDASVPDFGSDRWKQCFQQLTADPRVLGWIAFQGERLGACDVDYDAKFVEVLRTYHRTLENLRREVGMSAIQESSVVGSEGKVWFLTAIDDAWLALFLDSHTDPKMVSERLLHPVLLAGED